MTRWSACGSKARFDNEHHAGRVAAKYGQRIYLCTFCQGWHLTSQELRRALPTREVDTPQLELDRVHRALTELRRKRVTGPLLDEALAREREVSARASAAASARAPSPGSRCRSRAR